MGLQDRDWYQEELQRKSGQPNSSPSGESEFGRLISGRRSRFSLPYWANEWVRLAVVFGVLGLLYFAWTHFRS